uniref:Uncharacterized protein n=1 Tax=Kalanchoe fedtschenkoi TaxID=63787 RepID=A0A7N0TDB4_KALFE
MLRLILKNVVWDSKALILISQSSTVPCRGNAPTRLFCTGKPLKDSTFTVSYLVDSCGLTPEAAQNACKSVHLKSAKKPDRVLRLLRDNGFTDVNISILVARRPSLIVADLENTLKPKFQLFASLGVPSNAVVKMFLEYPEILNKSMDKSLLPSVDFLRNFLHTDEKIVQLINKCRGILRLNLPDAMGPNVGLLRDEGISDDLIATFLNDNPQLMSISAARFAKIVDRVRKMWIGPKKYGFLDAISVLGSMRDKEWERKVTIFKNWGWSDAEVKAAFTKQPKCMALSENKIDKIMKYLVNIMELDPLFPAGKPNVLTLCLKNQIIPRCSVIRYLLTMGVVSKEDLEISSVLECKEESFLKCFVRKYMEVLPELPDLYTFCKKCAATGRSQPL